MALAIGARPAIQARASWPDGNGSVSSATRRSRRVRRRGRDRDWPAAGRSEAGEHGGAGLAERASDHEHVTVVALETAPRRKRGRRPPPEQAQACRFEEREARDADVTISSSPSHRTTGHVRRQVAERDGRICFDAATTRAPHPTDARRNVHATCARRTRVAHARDRRRDHASAASRKPVPRSASTRGRRTTLRPRPAPRRSAPRGAGCRRPEGLRVESGAAVELGPAAEQKHHRPFVEEPRGGKPSPLLPLPHRTIRAEWGFRRRRTTRRPRPRSPSTRPPQPDLLDARRSALASLRPSGLDHERNHRTPAERTRRRPRSARRKRSDTRRAVVPCGRSRAGLDARAEERRGGDAGEDSVAPEARSFGTLTSAAPAVIGVARRKLKRAASSRR